MLKATKPALQFVAYLIVFAATARWCLAKDEAPVASPGEIVRKAVDHEIAANSGPGLHFMFTDRRKTAHLSQTKLIVETRDATAGIVTEQNGRPLTPQEKQAEEARLENYVHNPEELNKKRKQEKEDADHTSRILRALPDAFLYEREGTQNGSETVGRQGDELIKLKFQPNPNYVPPTRVEQVLTAMSGHLLIDPRKITSRKLTAHCGRTSGSAGVF